MQLDHNIRIIWSTDVMHKLKKCASSASMRKSNHELERAPTPSLLLLHAGTPHDIINSVNHVFRSEKLCFFRVDPGWCRHTSDWSCRRRPGWFLQSCASPFRGFLSTTCIFFPLLKCRNIDSCRHQICPHHRWKSWLTPLLPLEC